MSIAILFLLAVLVVIVMVFNHLDNPLPQYVKSTQSVNAPEWDVLAACHNYCIVVQAKKIPLTIKEVETAMVDGVDIGEEIYANVED
jgi:hypothetical protein